MSQGRLIVCARICAWLFLLCSDAGAENIVTGTASVFNGPLAAYSPEPPVAGAPTEVLRWVWVQERMQITRRGAAVRVPLFFSAGECHDPEELALVRWPSRQPTAVQADDVRRNIDGGVARLHLWFKTDLAVGETQRWALVRRVRRTGADAPTVRANASDGKLSVEAAGTTAVFYLDLAQHGPVAALHLEKGPSMIFPEGAGAAAIVHRKMGGDDSFTSGAGGAIEWGTGPVFAKMIIRYRGKIPDDEIEQVFRLFSDGSLNLIQVVKSPWVEEGLTVKTQDFLVGRLDAAKNLLVRSQSAGLVESLADVHRGYQVDGLYGAEGSNGWLVVPGSLGGTAGRVEIEHENLFRLHASEAMTSCEGDASPHSVKAFWSEVTFYPANRESHDLARSTLLTASQPLVAAVDRPGLDAAAALARVEDNVREMKPVGWVNETVVRRLKGESVPFPKRRWSLEEDPAYWIDAAQRAYAKITNGGVRRLAEDEKGRAAGPLDPYHITYGMTGIGYWLIAGELPREPLVSLRAQLEAVRRQLGRTDEQGWPYLDVFARTQNMQMGPPFLALADRGADSGLRRFYRDQLSAPQISAVALHGLRPYEGRPQNAPVPSDELYQGVVDFFLRASELVLNESLGFQPVAFGRYLDAIDVNADLYHPAHARVGESDDGFARANFFRMQSHLHRWLNWGPAPFVALLQSPVEDGLVPGSTEVWYFANALAGHWKNWPDQSWLFLAAELSKKTSAYSPVPRPAPVMNVQVRHDGSGNHLVWEKDSLSTAYRIYRLRIGHPPVWLNTPYGGGAAGDASELVWDDVKGTPEDRYCIHIIDSAGRESGW